jgi:trk system potassium uptake protein TrkA
MYIVVIGLGQVGRHVVRTLEWEKHDVVAVDNDPAAIEFIEEHHDVMTLRGYGASQSLLRRADVARADLVVAVTNHDEVNLIAALAARRLGAKQAVARVQGSEWTGELTEGSTQPGVQYDMLGVDVVFNPRVLLAQEVARIAQSHGALEVTDLADGRVEVAHLELGSDGRMLNKPLSKLPLPQQVLVAAVVRDGALWVPGGADSLLPHDRIYLVGQPEPIVAAEDLFTRTREAHRVCIVGGGVIGQAMAELLVAADIEVMLIERMADRAQRLAERLPKATVVHGDGTDLELLKEQRAGEYELFAAVTRDDEVNLMAGLLAKRLGAQRTVTLVSRPDYSHIYRQLGIDVVLSPRTVASEHVLRYVRQTELRSVTVLEDGQAEVLELVAQEGSRVADRPVRRIAVPRGAILAAIIKHDRVVVPHGNDVVAVGDTVVVLTTPAARKGVVHLFKGWS